MKIMYLSPWYPYPPDNGAKIRIYNLLRYLSKEHEITLVSFAPDDCDLGGLNFCSKVFVINQDPFLGTRYTNGLHFLYLSPLFGRVIKPMSDLVRSVFQGNEFSLAISFTSRMGMYLREYSLPKILDIDTSFIVFGYERLRLERTRLGKLRAWVSLQKIIGFERNIVSHFNALVLPTKDNETIQRPIISRARKTVVIGNGVDLQHYPFNLDVPVENTLIYNGSLTFPANYDAVSWFLKEIFPLIKSAIPSVTFKITGKLDGVDLKSLPAVEGVEVTGYVSDIRPVVSKSWVCVVPIRIGGGQRMKIFEAMALGTPIVSTSKGIEGLDICRGKHAIIADDPSEFARAVIKILQDKQERERLAQNARAHMEENYSWDKVLPRFQTLIEDVSCSSMIDNHGVNTEEVALRN